MILETVRRLSTKTKTIRPHKHRFQVSRIFSTDAYYVTASRQRLRAIERDWLDPRARLAKSQSRSTAHLTHLTVPRAEVIRVNIGARHCRSCDPFFANEKKSGYKLNVRRTFRSFSSRLQRVECRRWMR